MKKIIILLIFSLLISIVFAQSPLDSRGINKIDKNPFEEKKSIEEGKNLIWLYAALGAVGITTIILFLVILLKKHKNYQSKRQERLVAYIKSSLARGYGYLQIKHTLLNLGFEDNEIDAAFIIIKNEKISE